MSESRIRCIDIWTSGRERKDKIENLQVEKREGDIRGVHEVHLSPRFLGSRRRIVKFKTMLPSIEFFAETKLA